jgi:NADPH-dependent ferric siderophore reductase
MTMTTAPALPLILAEVEVTSVERLSPSFLRVELGGPELADFGVEGKLFDQRIKLIFPSGTGTLPCLSGADEGWYAAWRKLPDAERGHMRTYSVRAVRGEGTATRLVVDIVLHLGKDQAGPGSQWAAAATPGDRVVLVGPRRGIAFGGIEFTQDPAREVLLAGDETAVPAICRILADLEADARGTAFLEVPDTADVLDVIAPPGVEVVWLPRNGAPRGEPQVTATRRHLGLPPATALVADHQVRADMWETPGYSSSGESLASQPRSPHDLYAWIAGEARVVTTLRRCLVHELGLPRRHVAFMGYWRRGVAMRS